jgi:hypothetical protein
MMTSDCCGASVYFEDICSRCGEHCEVNSDDGYDAARDAYLTGDGPAFTQLQVEQDRAWNEEIRRLNRW